jgi:hypothetical protein
MEVEYLATCVATQKVIWLYRLSLNMGVPQHHPIVIYGDNQNVIKHMKTQKYQLTTSTLIIKLLIS